MPDKEKIGVCNIEKWCHVGHSCMDKHSQNFRTILHCASLALCYKGVNILSSVEIIKWDLNKYKNVPYLLPLTPHKPFHFLVKQSLWMSVKKNNSYFNFANIHQSGWRSMNRGYSTQTWGVRKLMSLNFDSDE